MVSSVTTSPQSIPSTNTTQSTNLTAEKVNSLLAKIEDGGKAGEEALAKLNELSQDDSNRSAIKSSLSIADKELLATIADSGNEIAQEVIDTNSEQTTASNLSPAETNPTSGSEANIFSQPTGSGSERTLAVA